MPSPIKLPLVNPEIIIKGLMYIHLMPEGADLYERPGALEVKEDTIARYHEGVDWFEFKKAFVLSLLPEIETINPSKPKIPFCRNARLKEEIRNLYSVIFNTI